MALSVDEFRKLLFRVSEVKSIEQAETKETSEDIDSINKLLDIQGVQELDSLRSKQILQDPGKKKVIERYSAMPHIVASLVPHVLDALIENSEGEEKEKYLKLKKQEDVIQKAALYSGSPLLKDLDVFKQIHNMLVSDNNDQSPLAKTLRICGELEKEGRKASEEKSSLNSSIKNPSLNPSISELIGRQQHSELFKLSTYYYSFCEFKTRNEIPDRIKAADDLMRVEKYIKLRRVYENQGLDDKAFADTLRDLSKKHYCKPDALKSSQFQGKFTVNKSFDSEYSRDSQSVTSTASAALDLSSPYHRAVHAGRVASNVPYAVIALNNQTRQPFFSLHVGQIQLAAMFLDAVRIDASESIKLDDQEKSIEAFKKFANDKMADGEIEKLASAMRECYDACGKGDPGELKGKPLAQVLYVSHQLDLLRGEEPDKEDIAATVKPRIEKVVGPEQGSLLINRSKEIIKATEIPPLIDNPDEELDASKFVATTKEVNQKVTREEIEKVKEAMQEVIEEFHKNKLEGIFVNAIESVLAKFDLELKFDNKDRYHSMKEAQAELTALDNLKNLSSVDKETLDYATKIFRIHAAKNTGFFGISRQTATSRKFEQSLKTKSLSRQ